MTITANKRGSVGSVYHGAAPHVPGFADYLIETRMLMTEHRVGECLRDMSDQALNSLGFSSGERAQLRGKTDTV